MAFDFLGTFKRAQVDLLFDFAEAHLANVEPRIRAIKAEIERLGWIEYDYDENGDVSDYVVRPSKSQLAKYIRAYIYHGGNPIELFVRSRGDWIYITKGDFDLSDTRESSGIVPSGGEYKRSNTHYNDTVPGNHVAAVKDWLIPSLKRRREDLEYRVKRNVDRVDQLIIEIVLLVKRSTGAETLESLQRDIEHFLVSKEFPSATE